MVWWGDEQRKRRNYVYVLELSMFAIAAVSIGRGVWMLSHRDKYPPPPIHDLLQFGVKRPLTPIYWELGGKQFYHILSDSFWWSLRLHRSAAHFFLAWVPGYWKLSEVLMCSHSFKTIIADLYIVFRHQTQSSRTILPLPLWDNQWIM